VVARAAAASLLVISPGPGSPERAGSCLEVVRQAIGRVPILGVCLGHQALVAATGGSVGRAPTPVHGKAVTIRHTGAPPFHDLPSPLMAARYHSLAATEVPPALEITADADGVVMAVAHRTAAALGVQFHPESVLTPLGGRLIENVLHWARHARR
jgi:anthranilate synthase component 2